MKKKRINKKKFRLVIDTLTEIGKTRNSTWKVTNPEPDRYYIDKYHKKLCRDVSKLFNKGWLYDGAEKIKYGDENYDSSDTEFIYSVIYDIYPELWGILFSLKKGDFVTFSKVRRGLTNNYKF